MATAACTHCGAVAAGVPDAAGHLFCCPGCAAAHSLIESLGLGRFYERRTRKILAKRMEDPAFLAAGRPTPFSRIQVPKKQWLARNGDDVKMPRPVVETPEEQEERTGKPSAVRQVWDQFFGGGGAIDPAAEGGPPEGRKAPAPG